MPTLFFVSHFDLVRVCTRDSFSEALDVSLFDLEVRTAARMLESATALLIVAGAGAELCTHVSYQRFFDVRNCVIMCRINAFSMCRTAYSCVV